MDRPLDTQVVRQRRRKKILVAGLALGALVAFFLVVSALVTPSIDRQEIQTAVVRRGPVDGTISAFGTVVPGFEQAMSSPGETRILTVRKRPGEFVKKGEAILDLDRSELTLAFERTDKDVALKANKRAQLKIDMERTMADLKSQLTIKKLRLDYLRSKSEQAVKMFELGGISKDQLNQTKLEEHIAEIEQSDLEQSITSTAQSLDNQLEGVTAEVRTLVKEKEDIRRQLDLLACTAERPGVLTWVKEEVGAAVHGGEVIARIADLSNYRVEATISDIHASKLHVGMPATVRWNDLTMRGHVQTVYPAIENGIAKVALALDDTAGASLRPNLRVDVFLVTSRRDSTLKVKKGPFVTNEGRQNVFVIRGSVAERVPVTVGVMGAEEVEIVEGLAAGDEIIISSMSDYTHLSQVKLH